jgi:uncharacterized protein (DUF1800 family)
VRGDLAAVVKAVLLDDEARSHVGLADPDFGKLREPLLRLVQWARCLQGQLAVGRLEPGQPERPVDPAGPEPAALAQSVFNYFRPGYVPAGTAMAAPAWWRRSSRSPTRPASPAT